MSLISFWVICGMRHIRLIWKKFKLMPTLIIVENKDHFGITENLKMIYINSI